MNFKNVFYLGVIAMTLVVLSSCSEDDDPEPTLIGTWLFESFDAGEHTVALSWLNDVYKDAQYTFKSDGTAIYTEDGSDEQRTWMLENKTLTFDEDTDDETTTEVRELSATTLKLSSGVNSSSVNNGNPIPVTLTFSKQ